MRFKHYLLVLLAILAIVFLYCSAPYEIDVPLPDSQTYPHQILPEEIEGNVLQPECGDDPSTHSSGCNGIYGDLGRITAILFDNNDFAYSYYDNYIKEINTSSSTGMGANQQHWFNYTHSDGYIGFVWHNNQWMFEIAADNEQNLNKLANAFDYIKVK